MSDPNVVLLETSDYVDILRRMASLPTDIVLRRIDELSNSKTATDPAAQQRLGEMLTPFLTDDLTVEFALHAAVQLMSYALVTVPPGARLSMAWGLAVAGLLTTNIRAATVDLEKAGIVPPAPT